MVEEFLKILDDHPVTKALNTGKLAGKKYYTQYMSMFKLSDKSIDPDALIPTIKRVASKQLARTKRR